MAISRWITDIYRRAMAARAADGGFTSGGIVDPGIFELGLLPDDVITTMRQVLAGIEASPIPPLHISIQGRAYTRSQLEAAIVAHDRAALQQREDSLRARIGGPAATFRGIQIAELQRAVELTNEQEPGTPYRTQNQTYSVAYLRRCWADYCEMRDGGRAAPVEPRVILPTRVRPVTVTINPEATARAQASMDRFAETLRNMRPAFNGQLRPGQEIPIVFGRADARPGDIRIDTSAGPDGTAMVMSVRDPDGTIRFVPVTNGEPTNDNVGLPDAWPARNVPHGEHTLEDDPESPTAMRFVGVPKLIRQRLGGRDQVFIRITADYAALEDGPIVDQGSLAGIRTLLHYWIPGIMRTLTAAPHIELEIHIDRDVRTREITIVVKNGDMLAVYNEHSSFAINCKPKTTVSSNAPKKAPQLGRRLNTTRRPKGETNEPHRNDQSDQNPIHQRLARRRKRDGQQGD